ncbi:hypothetical protein FRC12_020257, partial [Ceratobasidium sp. 428]
DSGTEKFANEVPCLQASMRQAAISVGRILRSALDTVVVSAGPWNKKGSSGFTSLSFPRTKNKDVSRLSCRLSQKLASTGVSGSPVVPHTGGARSLTGRAKKRRAGKQEAKKNSSGRTKLKPIKKSSTSYSNTQSQWTAVGAALGSLEESISRTNLLLHSLASGEAWARRTRSPGSRPSRDVNAALDSSSGRRTPGLADTTEALTSLLQELGQKQALQGIVEPGNVSLESIIRDPEHIVPIPTLQHGLDRVLFNPGVHWLQDPHSRVYNFPPELQAMPAFTSFAYEKVNTFITSSKDAELANLAKRQGKKFTGSTSSVSMILAHIYFLISNWRDVDTSVLSASFAHMSKEFSAGQKMPYTFYMRQNNGIVAFDSGSQSEDPFDQNILSYIGVMLEKLLTLPREEFVTLLRRSPAANDGKAVLPEREAYRYSMSKSIVLRSQLDCVDTRLPGTGVFDLKTRAAISVRQDVWNVE